MAHGRGKGSIESKVADLNPAKPAPPQPGELWHRTHATVLAAEIATINERRKANEETRKKTDPGSPPFDQIPERIIPPDGRKLTPDERARMDAPLPVVGLALSGGGIRSAAVCLGVLQALNNYRLLPHIDYLSTVSGGGYIGSAWSAAVAKGDGKFPFGDISSDKPRAQLALDKPSADEVSDTPSVAHIRNYSNFIIPGGFRDLLTGIAIVVRGLAVNIAIVLPFILFVAILTIYSNPTRTLLTVPDIFGVSTKDARPWDFLLGFGCAGLIAAIIGPLLLSRSRDKTWRDLFELGVFLFLIGIWLGLIGEFARFLTVENFGVTLSALLLSAAMFVVWGLIRAAIGNRPEFRGYGPTAAAIGLVLIATIAFFEAQPFVLDAMFAAADANAKGDAFTGALDKWIKWLTAGSVSLTAAVTFFRDKLANVLKSDGSSSKTSIISAFAAKAAIWLGGLALPMLIWIGYLHLSMWGIINDKSVVSAPCDSSSVQQCCRPPPPVVSLQTTAKAECVATIVLPPASPQTSAGPVDDRDATPKVDRSFAHIPTWLNEFAKGYKDLDLSPVGLGQLNSHFAGGVISFYLLFATALFVVSLLFTPNANSLHRLYRDRLSKAFLFNRDKLDARNDLDENDKVVLSGLSQTAAPYQLIGAALNIQASNFANRRGRNADFFLFSKNKVGSEATGYADTAGFEPGLDLASAMAISGAAASSNMGANSIRPLTPTLALLNVRLGYWLNNPRYLPGGLEPTKNRSTSMWGTPFYLWRELTGRLNEFASDVYLTDGGHIENLGIYELLRRRCKVIIAVDAEADPEMHLPSFVTLQRYARIDLGIIIDLPWSPIRERTLEVMANNATEQPKNDPKSGPHVAIGTINYGGDDLGYLVYIKSSLSGDENDYVRDYARRFSTFPHEATIEQFFSEEQFEVYRALGFHMTHGWLKSKDDADDVVVDDGKEKCARRKFTDPGIKALTEIRTALRWPPPPVPPYSSGSVVNSSG